MRRMKRHIALLLALLICFSPAAFGETDGAASPKLFENPSDAYLMLEGLGMLDDSTKNLPVDGVITRDRFAGLLVNLMGGPLTKAGDEQVFHDVDASNPYRDAIHYLNEIDVLHGTGGGYFEPASPLTIEQAAKIMVIALGYGELSRLEYGDDLHDYLMMANSLKITSGFTMAVGQELTANQAMYLLKNAALTPVLKQSAAGMKNEFDSYDDRTMLAEYCGIIDAKGTVTDNGITSLSGGSAVGVTRVTIGGKTMRQEEYTGAVDLIGYYVHYFYDEEEEILLYAQAIEDRNEVLELSADDLLIEDARYSVGEIVYWEGSKVKTAKISSAADLIYNGSAYPEFTVEELRVDAGSIKLVETNGDSSYDLVIVKKYDTGVVIAVNANQEQITMKNGATIAYGDARRTLVYEDGYAKDISVIGNGDVVSYMISKDGLQVELQASTKAVIGEVTTATQMDSDYYYEIDGVSYETAISFLEDNMTTNADGDPTINLAKLPQTGIAYTFKLDFEGRIAAIEESATGGNWRYAYVVNLMDSKESSVDQVLRMRVVLQDGTILDPYLAEKVDINGERAPASVLLTDERLWNGGEFARQVMKIMLNVDGDVSHIEIATDTVNVAGYNPDEFSRDIKNINGTFRRGNTLTIAGQPITLSTSTIIFEDPWISDPDGGYTAEDIEVRSTSAYSDGTWSNVTGYELDESLTAKIVTKSYANIAGEYPNNLLVVDYVSEKLNDDGDVVRTVYGFVAGREISVEEKDLGIIPDGLKRGDICRYALMGGSLSSLDVMVSAKGMDPAAITANGSSWDAAVWSGAFGYIYGNNGSMISLWDRSANASAAKPVVPLSLNGASSVPVTIYDMKADKVYAGSMADVVRTASISSGIDLDGDGMTKDDDGTLMADDSTPIAYIHHRYTGICEIAIIKP